MKGVRDANIISICINSNLELSFMFKNFFFDRDNTILYDKGYTHKIEDFKWFEGAKKTLKFLTQKNRNIFIVTNQAGIAKGKFTIDQYNAFTNHFLKECALNSITIKEIVFCPFHEDGLIKEFKKTSFNRKPNPGMLLHIIEKYNLSKSESILIGDSDSDTIAGKRAGIKSLKFDKKSLYDFLLKEEIF